MKTVDAERKFAIAMSASIKKRRDRFDAIVSEAMRGMPGRDVGTPLTHYQDLGALWEQFKNFEIDEGAALDRRIVEILGGRGDH